MKWTKLFGMVAAAATLCSCGGKPVTNPEKGNITSVSVNQTGGFREKDITPQGVDEMTFDVTVGKNEEIYVLMQAYTDDGADRFLMSTDKGESFTEQPVHWKEEILGQLGKTFDVKKSVQKDGSVFIYGGVLTGSGKQDWKPFVACWENGALNFIEVQQPRELLPVTEILKLSDGEVCVSWTNEIQVYGTNGNLEYEINVFDDYDVNALYMMEMGEELWIKDVVSNENKFLCWSLKDKTGEIVQDGNLDAAGYRTVDKQGNQYGMQNRLPVRRIANGEVWEQILSEREAPTLKMAEGMKVFGLSDGSLIVLTMADSNGKQKLLKYEYDETISYETQAELNVYSLTENPFIQYAVGKFQIEQPNVLVKYEIGFDGKSGKTKDDALKEINTRILAGDSPDVLILDGMSVDGMIRQGLLADISGKVGTGKMFPNIVETGKRDGKQYYLPTAVVPMVFLRSEGLAPLNSFEEILGTATPQIGMGFDVPVSLFWGVWPAAQTSVMQQENLDVKLLQRFFEDCKTAWGTQEAFETEKLPFADERIQTISGGEQYQIVSGDTFLHLVLMQYEKNPAINRPEKHKLLSPMIGYNGEKPFWALGMTAVSANAKQPELAEKFLQVLIDDEMQTCEIPQTVGREKDVYPNVWGVPVTENALNILWKKSTVKELWGDKGADAFENVKMLMKEINTAIIEDAAVEKVLYEQMMACVKGEVTSEQAAQNAMQVLEVKQAEKG